MYVWSSSVSKLEPVKRSFNMSGVHVLLMTTVTLVSELQLHFRQQFCVVEGSVVGPRVRGPHVGWSIYSKIDIIRHRPALNGRCGATWILISRFETVSIRLMFGVLGWDLYGIWNTVQALVKPCVVSSVHLKRHFALLWYMITSCRGLRPISVLIVMI